ncbi:ribose-phosphate pyrophosphokinase (plasmid) [Frondihabitans sucicola]|uniref:Ribose-phosphate pyrophosphokinase n=1 Tax=Frondihabitans sucicola TaxID=1268041 RepID=A0ABN6Y5Z8_9MICO|nr:ribose-phosphate pyrophosphokinase [Frondihabitans sucicola]BDZ52603.1 ribose-phosphate pyrophosphokinase [Frondihabitans sucicola]
MISFHSKSTTEHVKGLHLISGDTPITFPSGERHIFDRATNEVPNYVDIRSADANDYVQAAMWANMQHRKGFPVTAVIPFLIGARQDHAHEFGVQAYADLINSIHADRVVAFDTHSHVIEGLVDNLVVVEPARLVRKAIVGKDRENMAYDGIICPDHGAIERTQRIADICHLPVFHAEKHRDTATGELSGFSVEPLNPNGKYLVCDDICDGGGTFMGLADATGLDRDHLDLYVSHGVFSGRAAQLAERYGRVFTTDSLDTAAVSPLKATVINLLPFLMTDILPVKVDAASVTLVA